MDLTELYEFIVDGVYYTFTPKLTKVNFNGRDFLPSIVKRGNIKLIDNVLKNTLTVTFLYTNSFARLALAVNPENPILFTLYRNGSIHWQGQVLTSTGNGAFIELTCASTYSKVTRPFANKKIQILCNHRLYDQGCKVIKDAFGVTATINTVDTSKTLITVLALAQADNYFLDGFISFNNQTRRILKQTGINLRISYPFDSTPTGNVILYPGCDLTEDTCASKFNNRINHLGFKRLPPITPYDNKGIL